jgi:S1-C subfamily serine protease
VAVVSDRRGQVEQLPPITPPDNGAQPPTPSWPQGRSLRGRSLSSVAALALLFALAVLIALYATNLRISHRPSVTTNDINSIVNQKVSTAVSQLESQPPAAVTAFDAVRAGLVVIVAQRGRAGSTEDLGTGVIVDTQGDILTALHVVQGASVIKVTFADGTTSTAAIATSDPTHDIAVLVAARLPAVIVPAVLGPNPQVGDGTFAVGNPLGLVGSLSAGVISGLDRTFKVANGRTLSGMIQFDAAVNPGSSGGPLLNTKGQVIGIVTGLANPAGTDNFAGIGFAVPIATAGRAAGAPAK